MLCRKSLVKGVDYFLKGRAEIWSKSWKWHVSDWNWGIYGVGGIFYVLDFDCFLWLHTLLMTSLQVHHHIPGAWNKLFLEAVWFLSSFLWKNKPPYREHINDKLSLILLISYVERVRLAVMEFGRWSASMHSMVLFLFTKQNLCNFLHWNSWER